MVAQSPAKIEFTPSWQALLARPPQDWRLAEAALCVAQQFIPALHVTSYLQHLDNLASTVHSRLDAAMTAADKLAVLNHYLFVELGFTVNHAEYHDPRNSFLNEVLDRKLGIPVSLSVIFLDLARAIGLDAYGINFPGHFLVGARAADRRWYLDVDASGKELTANDIKILLARQDRPEAQAVMDVTPYLKPASQLVILLRMLRNLKKIYMDKTEVKPALHVIALILSLTPESPDELRDRGMIYQHIDYTAGALADLTRYLELVPQAQERALIESMMESMQQRPTRLH